MAYRAVAPKARFGLNLPVPRQGRKVRKRRNSPVAAHSGVGRFTQPTAAVQTWPPELVFMPHSRHSPPAPRSAQAGGFRRTTLSLPRVPAKDRCQRVDASSEPRCSGDQEQPCPDDDGSHGSRDALTGRRETFEGNGCRHDSHRARVHDPNDEEDRRQGGRVAAAAEAEAQPGSPGRAGIRRQRTVAPW
jgi:hypothetical protein